MKKTYKYGLLLIVSTVILLVFSCIETFTPVLDTSDTQNLLVVEGLITDQTGPFRVRLTESVPFYTDLNLLYLDQPVKGAEVWIYDDKENFFNLYENDSGWYETENKFLKGVPGNTYTLNIKTPDGIQYESTSVLMHEAPEIEKLYYEALKKTRFDELEVIEENWINILVDSKPLREDSVCMMWQFEETWRFAMPFRVWVNHGTGPGAPPESIENLTINPEQRYCYVTEPSRKILIESPIRYQGKNIHRFLLQSIGPNSDRLNIKYSMLLKQYVVSNEMYTMFKKLKEVNTESEGIYSKIPGQVFGNISNCETGEKVLGYFLASAVKTKRIFIDHFEQDVEKGSAYEECGWTDTPPRDYRGRLIYPIYFYGTYIKNTGAIQEVWSTDSYCSDCRKRGYNEKPEFWE